MAERIRTRNITFQKETDRLGEAERLLPPRPGWYGRGYRTELCARVRGGGGSPNCRANAAAVRYRAQQVHGAGGPRCPRPALGHPAHVVIVAVHCAACSANTAAIPRFWTSSAGK